MDVQHINKRNGIRFKWQCTNIDLFFLKLFVNSAQDASHGRILRSVNLIVLHTLKLNSSPAAISTTILFAEESLEITAFLHFRFVGLRERNSSVGTRREGKLKVRLPRLNFLGLTLSNIGDWSSFLGQTQSLRTKLI